MITYLYRASNLKSAITFLAFNSLRKSLIGAREKPSFLAIILFIIIIIIISTSSDGFSPCILKRSQHHLYK